MRLMGIHIMGDREVCREVLLKSMAFAKFAVGNNNTNAVQYNTPPHETNLVLRVKNVGFLHPYIAADLYLQIRCFQIFVVLKDRIKELAHSILNRRW